MDIAELRFLVVEDQGFQRWLVGNLIEGLGARSVFSAGDGAAALELLLAPDPSIDVVVSDLDMPGMDGVELIRNMALRGHPASLIVLSGLDQGLVSTVETMARAYGVNLLGTIQKPITAAKFEKLIARHRAPGQSEKRDNALPAFAAREIAAGLGKGEFETFFQPKADVKNGQIKGAEALVRWHHPKWGLVYPAAFIGTVESGGLIDDLTDVVAKDAANNCRAWRQAGLDASVSVNLSLASLENVSLSDRMLRLIERAPLEPRHMIFEVTESVATKDIGTKLDNLSRLRMKGFGLSIDDYGTGYSSMERLSRVPFTELKIDRAFVHEASSVGSSRTMLESSLELARKLGIPAVAEGVETQADWELLLSLGCPIAQGYYVARPMHGEEFGEWLRKRRQAIA